MKKQIDVHDANKYLLESFDHRVYCAQGTLAIITNGMLVLNRGGDGFFHESALPLHAYKPLSIEVPDKPVETNKQIAKRICASGDGLIYDYKNILDAVDKKIADALDKRDVQQKIELDKHQETIGCMLDMIRGIR